MTHLCRPLFLKKNRYVYSIMKNIPVRQINTNSKEPDFTESFSIRDVHDLLAGKDMVHELHRHDYFFILALKKGDGKHEIDFTPYKVCDNSIFFLRPGQVHQLNLKVGCTGYLMEFNPTFYYPNDTASALMLRKASNKNYCQLDIKRVEKLIVILNYVFQEYSDKQEGYQEVIKANLSIFFMEFIRNREITNSSTNTNDLYPQERTDELLELFRTHISTHKQTSQYADMLNLSSYQLNAITKATLGKNCSELINEYIILESKRFLLATSNQVNQIAYHLGYEDVSYFIRFFKKHTGFSPEAFRNNSK